MTSNPFPSAVERLQRGHDAFSAAAISALGGADTESVLAAEDHEPSAAVLACSDARVPVELIFGQTSNDLFVVRVAGGVPAEECLGSLGYAVSHLPTLETLVVLGHSRCGAVSAAADAKLSPHTYLQVATNPPLRSLIDKLMAAVNLADDALRHHHRPDLTKQPGYRSALIETAVVANTALTAALLTAMFRLPVVFGVFDLELRQVGHYDRSGWSPHLAAAPRDDVETQALVSHAARQQDLG